MIAPVSGVTNYAVSVDEDKEKDVVVEDNAVVEEAAAEATDVVAEETAKDVVTDENAAEDVAADENAADEVAADEAEPTPKAEGEEGTEGAETTEPAPNLLTDEDIRKFVNDARKGMQEQLADGFQFGDIMWLADFTLDWMEEMRLAGKQLSIEEAKDAAKLLVKDILEDTLPMDMVSREATIEVLARVAERIIDLTDKFDEIDDCMADCWQRLKEKCACC